MAIHVITYKSTAEVIRIDKSDYLTDRQDMTNNIKFEGTQNLISPSFYVNSTTEPAFNYVYIPEFKRYYYVSSKQWVSNNVWFVTLTVDVLFSHKDSILTLRGVASRLEDQGEHSMIVDNFITVEHTQEEDVTYTNFTIPEGKKGFNIQDPVGVAGPEHNLVFSCFEGNPRTSVGLISLTLFDDREAELTSTPNFDLDVYYYTLPDTTSQSVRATFNGDSHVTGLILQSDSGQTQTNGKTGLTDFVGLKSGSNEIIVKALLDTGNVDIYHFYIIRL